MKAATKTELDFDIKQTVRDVLNAIEKEREREIIARRFGLHEEKQTLEEIGKLLGITRERVRQIEKQAVSKLAALDLPKVRSANNILVSHLKELGNVATISELAKRLGAKTEEEHAHVSFLANLTVDIEVIPDGDHFYLSAALGEYHNSKELHELLDQLVNAIKKIGRPAHLEEIQKHVDKPLDVKHIHGIARAAKAISNLEDKWGLSSWPLVNPRSIRDKIYVILQKEGKPLHFSEIAKAIKNSNFKRRNVTTQAIHNELIKDDRFVLVGRGIYGLSEWGYQKGTVADVIAGILKKDAPLHRDEIVKRVLAQRQVKPTTIILNLQGKKQFKRVAKATYTLAE